MFMTTTNANGPLTMSSLEIADLTEKAHKHVLADIRQMLGELGKRSAEFSANVPDSYGRPREAYLLPKRECTILMSGYSIPMRAWTSPLYASKRRITSWRVVTTS